jgi:hypothetical protein
MCKEVDHDCGFRLISFVVRHGSMFLKSRYLSVRVSSQRLALALLP